MPTRTTTSEYQPSPPFTRISSPGGKVTGRTGMRLGTTTNPGTKPNMCVAPATNGDRASGLAPSQAASTTKMMKVTPAL
jgi:hypothetical protein